MGKKILAAWICLGLLFIVAGYLFTYQEEIRLNLNRIAHTQEILSYIYDLQNNLTDAETGAQAFIASGDEAHLTLYKEALGAITRDLEELQQLTAGEAEQEHLLKGLERSVGKRLDLLAQAITRRREQGAEDKEQVELSKEGKKLQAGIRKQLDKMEEVEKKLLDPQWAHNKKKRDLYLSLLTFGTFVSYSLLLIVFYLLNREIQQRKKVEQSLARYQANLRSLASQLSLTEERERRRLALYLHDQIGHTLALTNIRVGELQEATAAQAGCGSPAKVREIRTLLEQAIRDTQSLTFNISPPILYELGLAAALEWLTENFAAKNGIQARFETDHRHRQIEQDLEILLFQAVNELLFNALKHAQAQHVNVSLWSDDGLLKVGVDDDGQGFSPPNGSGRSQGGGFGLFSIRERLIPYNGRLDIKSRPDEGTLVTISIPMTPSIASES
jgi:signal transduction histidine kinase